MIATMPSPPRMWPTQVTANSTMRFDRPPAFISSPARRKNGMARSVKVLAPVTICWLMICGLKMPIQVISTTPAEHQREGDRNPHRQRGEQGAEEDAEDHRRFSPGSSTGGGRSYSPVNWAMSRSVDPAGEGAQEAKKRDQRDGRTGEIGDAVDPDHREADHRRAHRGVDAVLHPGAPEQDDGAEQDESRWTRQAGHAAARTKASARRSRPRYGHARERPSTAPMKVSQTKK